MATKIDTKALEALHKKLSEVPCVDLTFGIGWNNCSLRYARKGNKLFCIHGGIVYAIDGRRRSKIDLVGSWNGANDADRKLYCELIGLDFALFQKALRLDRQKEKEDEAQREIDCMKRYAKMHGFRVSKGMNE